MESVAKRELRDRTWERNRTLWTPFEWGGLMRPLAAEQAMLNTLGRAGVAVPLAIVDENWRVKEYQAKRGTEVDQAAIGQDRLIADMKVETGLIKLAIEQATNEYVLAAEFYDAKVRSLLMGAHEYAAAIELKMLAVEAAETELAIDKEALHLQTVEADIIKEAVKQAMVATEIVKNQLEAQKAVLRAAEAAVAAGEAEIKAEEALVSVAQAQAEKATLQADVAMIFARIVTLKLEAIKLDVGVQEIVAGFGFIKSKLDDMLQQYDTGLFIEQVKIQVEQQIAKELPLLLADGKAAEDLKNTEWDDKLTAQAYKESQTETELANETTLKATLVAAKEKMSDERLTYFEQEHQEALTCHELIYEAYEETYRGIVRYNYPTTVSTEFISS